MRPSGVLTMGRVREARVLDRETRTTIAVARGMLRRTGRYDDAERTIAQAERACDIAALLGALYDAGARLAIDLDATDEDAPETAWLIGNTADAVRAAHGAVVAAVVAGIAGRPS